jgi:hypothetical protein
MSKDLKAKSSSYIPGEITKDDENRLKSILDLIEKDPLAYEFLHPVDVIGLGLSDYYDYIKYPMDLGTVGKKLRNNKYTLIQEVLDDIQQIWTNCKIYNSEGSEFHRMADLLEKLTKKLIDKHLKNRPIPIVKKAEKPIVPHEYKPLPVSYNEKVEFTEKIREIDSSVINEIVENLQFSSPDALSYDNENSISILVDNINRQTFDKIIVLLREE